MPHVFINNKLVEADKAFVSYEDRGFRFGDGVFETIRVQSGVPYNFDWHMERLRKGLHALKIDGNLHPVHEQCRKLLKENNIKDGVLRIQMTRGIGSKGYLPDPKHPKAGGTTVIETSHMPNLPTEPVTLWMSSYEKISSVSLPVQYKLCQGVSSTLARIEAFEKGHFDALLLNQYGKLCETSSGNVFWLKDDTLFTPSLTCGALEGSMRANIMRLSPLPVADVTEQATVLADADEVFICNSLWGVIAVKQLEPTGYKWKKHAFTEKLSALIANDIAQYISNNASRW